MSDLLRVRLRHRPGRPIHRFLDGSEYATRCAPPTQPPLRCSRPTDPTELTGPVFGDERVGRGDADLTRQHDGEAVGQRIIVTGRVLDADGRPIRDTLVEIWQANAAGRYRHDGDQWPGAARPELHRRRPQR